MKNNQSKNNININQSNENIKMENSKNNIPKSKNNLSANYIMTSRKSILDRNNKNNNRRSKAPIKNKPSKKYIRKNNKENIKKLLNEVIEKKIIK